MYERCGTNRICWLPPQHHIWWLQVSIFHVLIYWPPKIQTLVLACKQRGIFCSKSFLSSNYPDITKYDRFFIGSHIISPHIFWTLNSLLSRPPYFFNGNPHNWQYGLYIETGSRHFVIWNPENLFLLSTDTVQYVMCNNTCSRIR